MSLEPGGASGYRSRWISADGASLMILYSAPASPFGRMVKLTAHCLGQIGGIEVRATNTGDPEDEIRSVNPLGKIPALVADGQTLFDSRVIVEFLDTRAGGGRVIPAAGPQRFEVLTRMAAMVGMLDAALLVVYEGRFRPPQMKVESFLDYQRGKIVRVLETVGAGAYANGPMPDAGEITLACALDYLDFRRQLDWRDHAPHLQDWLASFAEVVPGYAETLPRD